MNTAIELHDSTCLAIEFDSAGNGALVVDAYVYRSDGKPCETPGEGGVQRVQFYIDSISMSGRICTLPATIYEGSMSIGDSSLDLIPLPFESDKSCNLRLALLDNGDFCIAGKAVRVTPIGDFRFVEHVDFSANC